MAGAARHKDLLPALRIHLDPTPSLVLSPRHIALELGLARAPRRPQVIHQPLLFLSAPFLRCCIPVIFLPLQKPIGPGTSLWILKLTQSYFSAGAADVRLERRPAI